MINYKDEFIYSTTFDFLVDEYRQNIRRIITEDIN